MAKKDTFSCKHLDDQSRLVLALITCFRKVIRIGPVCQFEYF
ncbi:hypothetical protein HG66A1_22090 [Gimesia chilikensis]|uniref:Uncharacterized protein n=1 Tax=Gimesia chilikensis TaxID=2605989 RepID=A0A517PM26_9PLAN|nr:hypothetical protein HG66A1_22090 [Gimesia chilikensis]